MVSLRIAPLVLAFLTFAQGLVAASELAPADEYFGPFHQSILEIRNRLTRFETESSGELAQHLRGIDTLEASIEDWYRRYPHDPWISGFAGRLIRVYARANASHNGGCLRAQRIARAERS